MAIDFDRLVLEVAARFKQHGMQAELQQLRAFYRDRRQRQRGHSRAKQAPWDEDLVLKWAALWRISPLENVYPLLPRGSPCTCGAKWTQGVGVFVEVTFPEGHVLHCQSCDTQWLVLSYR